MKSLSVDVGERLQSVGLVLMYCGFSQLFVAFNMPILLNVFIIASGWYLFGYYEKN